jgi:hypothetical protein
MFQNWSVSRRREWYLDRTAQTLYLFPNSTTGGKVGGLRAAVLESVVVVNGTEAAPVVGVSFEGLAFGETAPTFLAPHERPISVRHRRLLALGGALWSSCQHEARARESM